MIFKTFSARSFGERAKIIVAVILLIAVLPLNCLIAAASDNKPLYAQRNFLRTSYNSQYYSLFQINGNTITARGRYYPDKVRRVRIEGRDDYTSDYKMKVESDGSYEAELTCNYESRNYETIIVEFSSGKSVYYRIQYDNGWYFPDNGLSETNRNVFDSIIDASPESVGYYISETADPDEIKTVQEQIKLISDSVTEGIESDYEKARALSLYVAEHFYYDHDARDNSVTEDNVVLYEVLKTSRTICIGFANLYCALLQAQGIDAVNIKGGSTGGRISYENLTDGVQNHEFTAFYHEEESRWVWVDACWNGSGDYYNGEYIEKKSHEKFFDITDEALALDHRADYAERRLFFEAKAASPDSTKKTTTETSPVTEDSTPKETGTTEKPAQTTENYSQPKKPEAEDDTVLVIIAAVLGVLVAGTGIAVFFILKGNKST